MAVVFPLRASGCTFLLLLALLARAGASEPPALGKLAGEQAKPVVYLLSFPGSGNTWLRHLVQEGTRLYSGSIYGGAKQLEKNGFPHDRLSEKDFGTLSVIKSHGVAGPNTGSTHHGHARVVLSRHPCAALTAEYRRQMWKAYLPTHKPSPTERASSMEGQTAFFDFKPDDRGWNNYLNVHAQKWTQFMADVASEPAAPVIYVYYEELLADLPGALERLFGFLLAAKPALGHHVPGNNATTAASWMTATALGNVEGMFHRPHPSDSPVVRHWSSDRVRNHCAAFAPWWDDAAVRWWGRCNETCL